MRASREKTLKDQKKSNFKPPAPKPVVKKKRKKKSSEE